MIIFIICGLIIFHIWLHLANPYARWNFVKQPFSTKVEKNGVISYEQHFTPTILHSKFWDWIGYYRQGFLIIQNTFFGSRRSKYNTVSKIINDIHEQRFNPTKPYLISGDQFSVLYPRNLGVFYNSLLKKETAHSKKDWENRQCIYLQSTLLSIEGLSAGTIPKTTIIPIGPRSYTSTIVHPGDVGSDAVYGMLFALEQLLKNPTTKNAAEKILRDKKDKLIHTVNHYVKTVQSPFTKLVNPHLDLASARDGVTRDSSFYDNIVLWKTLQIANKLGIYKTSHKELQSMQRKIKKTFWNEKLGYYQNDINDNSFSGDWLLAYVIGFLSNKHKNERARTIRTIDYIRSTTIAEPLPLKYEDGIPRKAPFIIRLFVPNYGGNAIWSYWGAQYITLLTTMYKYTKDISYKTDAERYIRNYDKAITRDGGFAETFNPHGEFLTYPLYKSIRITGWVVQYEYARKKLESIVTKKRK